MRDDLLSTDEETRKAYSRDASLFEIPPKAVAFPKDAREMGELVRYATDHVKEGVSLTCRSGGTDMTGGPLGESVVVDMARHFCHVKEVGDGWAVAEPGVFYRDFEKETLKKGMILPSYPASRELCTLGGMVANNAGGERTLQYGKTDRYVKALKAVLADGNEYILKPLSAKELEDKKKLQTFEGEIYRKTHTLLQEQYDAIQKARPAVSKNSAGYALWDVWDKERGVFDLTKLFLGSQGTLGIVTEITFCLVEPKKHRSMLVVFLNDLRLLGEVISRVVREKPESFESYDDHTLKIAVRFFPDFAKLLRVKNLLSLAWQFFPEIWMMASGGIPKLILMAEFTGDSFKEAVEKARKAKDSLKEFRLPVRLASSRQEAQKYFAIRRESFNLLRHHVRGMRTAPFIDDVIVRPEKLPEFLPRLQALLNGYPRLIYTIAGHMGDGNFHIIPLVDPKDPNLSKTIEELSRKVYDLVLEYKGSITAEHNDGLIRTPFLEQMYGKEITALFKQVKDIFDPLSIFNPKKKVDGTLSYAMSHLRSD